MPHETTKATTIITTRIKITHTFRTLNLMNTIQYIFLFTNLAELGVVSVELLESRDVLRRGRLLPQGPNDLHIQHLVVHSDHGLHDLHSSRAESA